MKIIEDNKNLAETAIFNLNIKKGEELVGNITLYRSKKAQARGILDIFIIPKYRCKWLNKTLAISLYQKVILTSKKNGLTTIITKAIHPNSHRLLVFFGFQKYNNNNYFFKF